MSSEPDIIIDASHNPAGFEKTLAFLNRFYSKEQLNVITFLQEDKDFQKIGDLLINSSRNIYLADLKLGKPLDPQKFLKYIRQKGGNARLLGSFQQAKEKIFRSASLMNYGLSSVLIILPGRHTSTYPNRLFPDAGKDIYLDFVKRDIYIWPHSGNSKKLPMPLPPSKMSEASLEN